MCLLLRSSRLTVEGGRQVGAARLLHRRGGRAAAAASVSMALGVPGASVSIGRVGCSESADSPREARAGGGREFDASETSVDDKGAARRGLSELGVGVASIPKGHCASGASSAVSTDPVKPYLLPVA
jgi:hypothetical protein